jgi:microcystin-dependent protein
MSDQYLGEIRAVAFTYPPYGWALCNGALLSISQYSALFALLGTTYGGNGQSTFGLPNLLGRCIVGAGQSTTGATYVQGQAAGIESTVLIASNLPSHAHSVSPPVSNALGTQADPTGAYLAQPNTGVSVQRGATPQPTFGYTTPSTGVGPVYSTGLVGGNTPISIVSPYQSLLYVIALTGIFPSRN